MKRIIFLIIIILGASTGMQCQNLQWAKALGNSANNYGQAIVTGASGCVYTTGWFRATVDFDPGPGVYNLTSTSIGNYDIFISKLDASGNFLWAKNMGGLGDDIAYSIAVDALDNVYTTGYFTDSADFDPGPNVNKLFQSGMGKIFISKLNASGSFVWVKQLWGGCANSIALDLFGNVYTTGWFFNYGDFDPGPGNYTLSAVGNTQEIFISKLDSAGNFIWAKSMGGSVYDYGQAITVDVTGNVYTTGLFGSTADFDPGPGIYNLNAVGSDDVFISKLDPSGNFLWAKGFGSTVSDIGNSIAVDGNGNVYTTGTFGATVDFDPGPLVHNITSFGDADSFVSKLNSSGNYVWAKHIGGTNGDYSYSIVLDNAANIYIGGAFYATADFDPGPGTFTVSPQGAFDAYLCELDSSGLFKWAGSFGNTGYDFVFSVFVDASNNIHSTGYFNYTVDFDPGSNVYNVNSFSGETIFILKLNDVNIILGQSEKNNSMSGLKSYPNPVIDKLIVELDNNMHDILVTDIIGNEILKFDKINGKQEIQLQQLNKGIYFLKVDGMNRKIIKD